jgi:hypoxanthine-guanine phosphoribosyltransferase
MTPDFRGFMLPDDAFVIGYGLDLDGKYRNMTDIVALDQNVEVG